MSFNAITRAEEAVLVKSGSLPEGIEPIRVRGYDFSGDSVNYGNLLDSYRFSGFQATNFGLAVDEVNRMIDSKCQSIDSECGERNKLNPNIRPATNCTIFLSYTSNLVSSGVRETINFLVRNNLVDCIVTSAGGVEEDFIKCLAPTFLGKFDLDGRSLRKQGINRIGNLLVPNDNYCIFENWLNPILDTMVTEQKQGFSWTPSKFIDRLGKEINNSESIYYWAHRNRIPVFCPALTDGSIGDMLYFHSLKHDSSQLKLDIVEDICLMNSMAVYATNTGMIILGGGVIKHHTCNANLMRNGADFAVYVNTGQEFDGSDSGAGPDEAISWGKIRPGARPVKLHCEASLVFPLIVARTFAENISRLRKVTIADK